MAVLELLAGTARALLVASHIGEWLVLGLGLALADLAGLIGRAVTQLGLLVVLQALAQGNPRTHRGTGDGLTGLVGHQTDLLGRALDLQIEQVAHDLFLEGIHHRGEHLATLTLVLHQRVALRHGTQTDSLAQVVHLVEVFPPLAVQDGEQHLTLQLTHGVLAQSLFPTVVGTLGVVGEGLDELVGVIAVMELGFRQFHGVHLPHLVPQGVKVPVLGVALGVLAYAGLDDAIGRGTQLGLDVGPLEHLAAVGVDDVTLTVHDVVILEDVLSHLEVLRLDLLLGALDLASEPLGLQGNVVGDVEGHHGTVQHLGLEQAHELVLHRQVESRLPRVALTAGSATKLVVDAPRLVTLRAHDVEPTQFGDLLVLGLGLFLVLRQRALPRLLVGLLVLDGIQAPLTQVQLGEELRVATEDDVGTTTGHVRRHGDRPESSSLGDDGSLGLVMLGVEHLVRYASAFEGLGEHFGLGDRGGTDEHRLPGLVTFHDVGDDGVELGLLGAVDEVLLVLADHGPVCRDRDDAQAVDLLELGLLGLGGTRHAGELVVHAEVVLQGDRRQGLVLVLDLDVLLGLQGLVQTFVVPASCQGAARVLVDDEDLAVHDDVVLVAVEEFLGLDGVVEVADEWGVDRLVEVLDAQSVLHHADSVAEDGDGALLLVDLVVLVATQRGGDTRELGVPLLVLLGGTGDDERGTGLVDEDRVDLVDDGVVVATLHAVVQAGGHVVAQVVETELVVRTVDDVCLVGLLAFGRAHLGEDGRHVESEEVVDASHLLRLHLGEVVVDGDDVDALARQTVEVGRQQTDEGLALTGLHLGDVALVQGGTTHDLDVEVTFVEHPLGGLAHRCVRLGKQMVEVLAVVEALLEVSGLATQLVITHGDVVVLDAVDLANDPVEATDDLAFSGVQCAVQQFHDGCPNSKTCSRCTTCTSAILGALLT